MRPGWRRSVIYLTLLGAQGCWLYAVLTLANRHALQDRVSVIGLLVIYPASFAFNRALEWLGWHRAIRVTLSWLGWLAAMLLMAKAQLYAGEPFADAAHSVPQAIGAIFEGFRPELFILLASILLWWLGWRLALTRPGFRPALAELQFGVIIIIAVFFIAAELGVSLPEAVPTILVFFIFALSGIALGHAAEGSGWLAGNNRPGWSLLLAAIIGLVVALGWLIGSFLSPDLLQYVLDGLKWLWGMIVQALTFIASLFPKPEPGEMPLPTTTPGAVPTEEPLNPWDLSEITRSRLQIAWTVFMVGFLGLALWRVSSQIMSWLRRRLSGLADAESEPLKGAFRADLLAVLRRLWRFLASLPLRLFRRNTAVPENVPVRQVYRRLLRWAAAKGFPRAGSQTPYEYFEYLAAAVPQARGDLAFVTEQYIRARYSPLPPDPHELVEMKQRWQSIKKARLKKPEPERSRDGETGSTS